jgi:hypothetical protein
MDAPDQLRVWRQERGLTMRQFAQAVGVSPSTVATWEKGRNRPGGGEGTVWTRLSMVIGVPEEQIRAVWGLSRGAKPTRNQPVAAAPQRDLVYAADLRRRCGHTERFLLRSPVSPYYVACVAQEPCAACGEHRARPEEVLDRAKRREKPRKGRPGEYAARV